MVGVLSTNQDQGGRAQLRAKQLLLNEGRGGEGRESRTVKRHSNDWRTDTTTVFFVRRTWLAICCCYYLGEEVDRYQVFRTGYGKES